MNLKHKNNNDEYGPGLSRNVVKILNEIFRDKKELPTQKTHKRDGIGTNQRYFPFQGFSYKFNFL